MYLNVRVLACVYVRVYVFVRKHVCGCSLICLNVRVCMYVSASACVCMLVFVCLLCVPFDKGFTLMCLCLLCMCRCLYV